MSQTSREIVRRALTFGRPERVPRDLWLLPWAEIHFPRELQEIRRRFPPDFASAPTVSQPSSRIVGDPYRVGRYTDEWGCTFVNIQEGAIGEVREPLLPSLEGSARFRPPYEILPSDPGRARDTVNRASAATEKFVLSDSCARPWERYQFIRGSQEALMDVASREDEAERLLRSIQDFYMRELEFWVRTDVDGVRFMDDWGAQRGLLISPASWREIFKPLYKEYCDIAHAHGKFIFMHSDGNIQEILPDLVEIGVDALNSQLFCMDLAVIAAQAKGRITFWGEIDRQHVLPSPDPGAGRRAVREVARHLYDKSGGIIAQLEFGLAANPATVSAVYDEWERIPATGTPG
jgi:hypothetical protein